MWEDPDEAGNTESLNPNDSSFPGEETSPLQVGESSFPSVWGLSTPSEGINSALSEEIVTVS